MEGLEIIEYKNKYQKEFRELNLHWLKKFELYEKADDYLLDNPEEFIKNGATIFLAHLDNNLVGTICLNPLNNTTYEILKFAVSDGYKRLGIGNKLLQIGINLCKQNKAETIFLESSSKLQNALKLYEKYGFEHVEVKETHFVTADIKMELKLK
ncbi:GNAT family N-acetyltransferase [Polaribacter vadi]|uniref:GNAT family N-acetyltransferase n=1 Tax=Polaribacter TaxID=52959 RepID=UPI001C088C6D|nr:MULTISPECIES: GNAT family N-acetyltransferase [Polaribacter]MBU3012051.1 GNAT family N-acetyltransferase [Polaribacter vadi]MDO6741866.1 GNAT family N-acetyltransferase [Polaribacter sp. 1_MG-2023]